MSVYLNYVQRANGELLKRERWLVCFIPGGEECCNWLWSQKVSPGGEMGMDWMWEDQIQLCLSESGPGVQGAGWDLNESRVSEDDEEKTVTVWGLGLSF